MQFSYCQTVRKVKEPTDSFTGNINTRMILRRNISGVNANITPDPILIKGMIFASTPNIFF